MRSPIDLLLNNDGYAKIFQFGLLTGVILTGILMLLFNPPQSIDTSLKFCDNRVAQRLAETHPSNATVVIFPKNMTFCTPTPWGATFGYNCFDATENMTWVIEVYSK